MNLKLFTIITLVSLAAIFIVQNAEVVELRLLFWRMEMSRALMFVFFMLIGVVVGWFLHGHMLHKSQENKTKEYDG